MLTQEIQQMLVNNRKGEKAFCQETKINNMLNAKNYADLMISVFNYCRDSGLSKSTAYLAKIYLDIVLHKSNFIDSTKLSLLSLTCIWLALKFNEPIMISQQFNTETICYHGQYSFTVEQLNQAEIEILQLLGFRLRYTTPYDYIHPFFQCFPWLMGTKKALPDIIEMSVGLVDMSYESSENIFYGAFLAICELKKCTLKLLQQKILASQIRDINKVIAIRRVIVERYNQIIKLQEKIEDQQQNKKYNNQ